MPHRKPVAWSGFSGALDAPRKGGEPLQFRRNSETQSLDPGSTPHRQAEELRWVGPAQTQGAPTPAAAHPCRPPPRTPGSRPRPRRAPSPQSTARSLANTVGEEAVSRVAASVPVLSGAPRPAPGPTEDRRPSPSGGPPRPHGLPAVPPDPRRPVPGPLAAEAQRRSGSGEHATRPPKTSPG